MTRSSSVQVAEPIEKSLPNKNAVFTTEFWKSFIYSGLSIATGLGAIGPSVPDKYRSIIDSAAFLAGAICVVGYAFSRGKTKAATVEAAANVLNNERNLEVTRQLNHLAKTPSAPAAKQASQKP